MYQFMSYRFRTNMADKWTGSVDSFVLNSLKLLEQEREAEIEEAR